MKNDGFVFDEYFQLGHAKVPLSIDSCHIVNVEIRLGSENTKPIVFKAGLANYVGNESSYTLNKMATECEYDRGYDFIEDVTRATKQLVALNGMCLNNMFGFVLSSHTPFLIHMDIKRVKE